jgi:Cysteine-rich CPXCG
MKTKKKPKRPERGLCESIDVACPFCGVVEPMAVDEGGGEQQTLVEDCPVCCKPRVVQVDSSRGSHRVARGDGM